MARDINVYEKEPNRLNVKNNLLQGDAIGYRSYYVGAKEKNIADNVEDIIYKVQELEKLKNARIKDEVVEANQDRIFRFIDDRVNKLGILFNVVAEQKDEFLKDASLIDKEAFKLDMQIIRYKYSDLINEKQKDEEPLSFNQIKKTLDNDSLEVKGRIVKSSVSIYDNIGDDEKSRIGYIKDIKRPGVENPKGNLFASVGKALLGAAKSLLKVNVEVLKIGLVAIGKLSVAILGVGELFGEEKPKGDDKKQDNNQKNMYEDRHDRFDNDSKWDRFDRYDRRGPGDYEF